MDSDLRPQLEALTARVQHLEQLLQARGLSGVPANTANATPPPPRTSPAPPQRERPRPPAPVGPTVQDVRHFETQLGSQIFNRVGIFALLVGMAWFLKFAIDNQWIGPLGRVIIGLLIGGGIVLWSERFRRRGYVIFSYSLKAVGSGTLYLSLWAAYSLYHFVPSGVAFGLMILVTAWNGYMAWAQNAELLALYAIVGGFGTPVLVSTGENHELVLFSYLLILDLAVLVLISLRPWYRLILSAFAGTLLLANGWAIEFYSDQALAPTALFVALFFILFAIAPRLASIPDEDREFNTRTPWEGLVFIVLPLANAALSFYALYNMLDGVEFQWTRPWAAVAFAAFYLLLLRRPLQKGNAERAYYLSALDLTSVVVFLTIAIPLQAHGHWLITGWLVEGGALIWVAKHSRLPLLRTLAVGALILGLGALLQANPDIPGTVVFNPRFATYLVAIAVFGYVAWLAIGRVHSQESQKHRTATIWVLDTTVPWTVIAAVAAVLINFLILLAVRLEIHAYWYTLTPEPPPAPTPFAFNVPRYVMYEEFCQSIWAMLFGALLLALGFWKRSAFVRWQALVLLTLSIAKVFLVDIGTLSQGYRVLSFLGLGALLLAISFVYQRDWLGLRAGHGESVIPETGQAK